MRLALHTFLSLDGVMQAPGGPDEDPSGGFSYGGWTHPYNDDEFGSVMADWISQAGAFLLGRRTYEIFAGYWPKVTDPAHPIAGPLNQRPKYVVSRTLAATDWRNSQILGPNLVDEIRSLKQQPGGDLQVHGSGQLAQTLIEHDLIDEYRLLTFPVHLGTGRKLFTDGLKPAALRLTGSRASKTGVVLATYEPDGPVRLGEYRLEDQ